MSGNGSNSNAYDQTRVPGLYAATITLAVLQTIAVVARFAARRISAATLGWDDYTIVLALVRYTKSSRTVTLGDKLLALQCLRFWTSGSVSVTGSQSGFATLAVILRHMAVLLPSATLLSFSK